MQGTIKEDSFSSLGTWTWEPYSGDKEGILAYIQSKHCVFKWLDFRKHPDKYTSKEVYRKYARTYHVENKHPDPPKGSIPRLRGSLYLNNECYASASEEPFVSIHFAGFEQFTIHTKAKKFALILKEAIDQLTLNHFKPIEERNNIHLHMLTRSPDYRDKGAAF